MKIELICTGSELLTGKVNTNAAYIGSRLSAIGFEISLVTDVGDKKQDLLREFKRAFKRSNIVITTGGLGPTFDDITVETAAECLNLEIYPDEKVLNSIKEYFLKRSVAASIPKINEKQANIIRGAKVLENRVGTAPGQMLHFKFKDSEKKYRKTLFLLPGPPEEMKPIFEENVEPFLKSYSVGIKKNGVLHVFGIAESAVEEMIKPVMEEAVSGDSKFVEFGILASKSVIDIKFSVSGTDELFVDETISKLKLGFGNVLKDNIFGFDNDTLASVAGRLLLENKKTVSFAESCTGGNIAAAITDIPGSSLYFKSSVVTYSNESKMKLLGVKEETLTNFGAVSKETVKEMAEGVLKLSDSDYAFSVTGIAGPIGGTKKKPVGLVYIGSADKKKTESFKFNFSGTRKDIRKRTVNTALDLLRRKLIAKHSY
ncbi:putative competence-damage inducible protein [Endomicrobiia bacterium]|uniref:competence/damage-inducible protein A n=1 Tax=Endomicrobium trichonymphae TaxID=1408204 RepID=UPI000865082A|nr:competence/damage-inducible protein A [Candidatus Endomicrobium trichonymphae]GHT04462.1 putative competence-damage inducible protein [Endomicrobiia bacterium]BAV58612.1 CinA-like protein [Candidatus Endomicrobium trichonymphae]GHT07458.1 putative competence-damage inducible protein [Endomicrobiia bacterium]GHT14698.1 putative competence-damage inducible protein [Endomicrobiia bacterium]GHT15467.1 putative competence-damage inducible protein [Endomicrobiia bacterium]